MVYVAKPAKAGHTKWGTTAYELEERHEQAVQMLAAGLSTASAAEAIGVDQATVTYWKRNPIFKRALADAIGMDAELHKFELIRLYAKAQQRVDELLDSKNEQIRLQASRLIFEAHAATIRLAEEQQVLAELEQRMDAIAEAAGASSTAILQAAEDAEFEELDNNE